MTQGAGHDLQVLVADDDADARQLMAVGLGREGMRIVTAADGAEALRQATTTSFDVLVLDVEMPGLQGFDVLEALRDLRSSTPVIFVTGRTSEGDRILGLDLGADDYVPKPVSTRELAARIRAVARRRAGARQIEVAAAGLVVDREARRVAVGGVEVPLSPKEFDVLASLVEVPDKVLTRDELLERIWGSAASWQSRTTLIEHVRRIRVKLDGTGHDWGTIENVRAVGYRYEPPATAA